MAHIFDTFRGYWQQIGSNDTCALVETEDQQRIAPPAMFSGSVWRSLYSATKTVSCILKMR